MQYYIIVIIIIVDSYVSATARSGGAAAEQAAGRKIAKYNLLAQTGRLFQLIAAETLGPVNQSSIAFFLELGRNIAETNESPAFFSSAFRSLFSALTRSCSTTVSLATRSDHFSFSFTFNFAFNPREFYTRGYKIIIITAFVKRHKVRRYRGTGGIRLRLSEQMVLEYNVTAVKLLF